MSNKFAFELSLALFILGSVLEGVAPDIYFFLVSRVLMGVGAGGLAVSYWLNVPSGASIIFVSIIIYAALKTIKTAAAKFM